MAELDPLPRPPDYSVPNFRQVERLLVDLRRQRDPKLVKMRAIKRARRDQWDEVLAQIPASFRKMAPILGFPDLAEMGQRISGMIAKQEPIVEVTPPSAAMSDIKAASGEEARMHAARITIEDQADRPTYAMGIDAQVHWGESWISVMPDPRRLPYDDTDDDEKDSLRRKKDETAGEYLKRAEKLMAHGGIPIVFEDHDPMTVFPLRQGSGIPVVIVDTEHTVYDIELGLGYSAIRNEEGKPVEWVRKTLSEPFVAAIDSPSQGGIVDTTHDNPASETSDGRNASGRTVRRIIYFDCWVVQTYLDGVLAEQWEHDYGVVPMFPALGEQTSDRDPGWDSRSLIEGALVLARQIVLSAAMLTSNQKLHGFPTPFLKNPDHGLSFMEREPLVRKVQLGEMNLLGPNEEISFPYLQAGMAPDFYKNLEFIMGRLEGLTMQSWGKNINPETSGYAIAQLRALQHSILSSIYGNAARQWRKIFAFLRHLVKTTYPAGIYMRGAVETKEVEGEEYEYAPVLKWAADDCTDFAINVHIPEGVLQDEMAERKSALEMQQGGIWSKRRAREKTGVEDPGREDEEIRLERMLGSPAFDMYVLQLAQQMGAQRVMATRQDMSTPFMQALEAAKAGGTTGPGQPQLQGAEPVNAGPGGIPQAQQPPPDVQQPGGPTEGPSLEDAGVPGLPGGVRDTIQTPAVQGV